MLYIKLENQIKEKNRKINFINNKICKFKNRFYKLKEEKVENGEIIFLPNLEKYIYEKLFKYLSIKGTSIVCISNELIKNQEFVNFLRSNNIVVLDGRWIFRYMSFECVQYICNSKKEKLNYQEISILSNDIDRNLKQIIFDLAKEVRVLNIVTKNENKFNKIEKELYNEQGIILNINNNYQKSLVRSDIILNFDFEEDEINKYNINSKSCIINLKNNINIKQKSFAGINVDFFELTIPMKYIRETIKLNDFNVTILYESLIYKKTSPENIKNEIKKDNININFLIGKNGRIRKNEYLNLSKKISN